MNRVVMPAAIINTTPPTMTLGKNIRGADKIRKAVWIGQRQYMKNTGNRVEYLIMSKPQFMDMARDAATVAYMQHEYCGTQHTFFGMKIITR